MIFGATGGFRLTCHQHVHAATGAITRETSDLMRDGCEQRDAVCQLGWQPSAIQREVFWLQQVLHTGTNASNSPGCRGRRYWIFASYTTPLALAELLRNATTLVIDVHGEVFPG